MLKKIVKIILIIIIIMNALLITKSYGICNTIRADKRISAVRLTLASGQVLCSAIVSKKDVISDFGTLDFTQVGNAKNLDLIFVIDTNTDDLAGEKAIVNNAISNFSTLYTADASKLRIGILGFNDEYKEYENEEDFAYELKNYEDDSDGIEEELNNLETVRKFQTSN